MRKISNRIKAEIRPKLKDLSLNYWRILVASCNDGTIVHDSKINKCIQWRLSAPYKLIRLQRLLSSQNIHYTVKPAKKSIVGKLPVFLIRVYGKAARDICHLLNQRNKQSVRLLPDALLRETYQVRSVVLAECLIFGGEIICPRSGVIRTSWINKAYFYARLARSLDFRWNICSYSGESNTFNKDLRHTVRVMFPEQIKYFQII